jgi:hypothetical protein
VVVEIGTLSNVLEKPDYPSIVDSYLAFDNLVTHIKANIGYGNYLFSVDGFDKKREIWWDKPSSGKGLAVIAYDTKVQTVMAYDSKEFLKAVERLKVP